MRIKLETGDILTDTQIKRELNSSFPPDADLTEYGYPFVIDDPQPETTAAQTTTLGAPYDDNGTWRRSWTLTERPIDEVRADRKEELAALRYEKETAGITVGGAPIRTDRTSQALINGAYSYSLLNPAVVIDWKTTSGIWVQIDAPTIAAIAGAAAAHVQACFSAEKVHAQALDGLATAAEVAAYDLNTGWPA